jgi:acetyltransferase-like isoleucine patch superfamily enzyme
VADMAIRERLRGALLARRELQRRARRAVQRAAREHDRLVLGVGSYAGAPDIAVSRGDPDHRVVVGNYSSIADEVTFLIGGEHHPEWVSTFPFRIRYGLPGRLQDGQPRSRGPITIGSDVWIGRGAIVTSGVTIGDGAVVGARTVVVHDVEPYAIVAGAPNRQIRKRFTDEQIAALLQARWWDWPEDEVLSIVDLLCSPDVERLLAYARRREARVAPAGEPRSGLSTAPAPRGRPAHG